MTRTNEANERLAVILPWVKRTAFGVRAIRQVLIYRGLLESALEAAERIAPNETGFFFEKHFDSTRATIIFSRIRSILPGKPGTSTIWYEHLDPNEVGSGHTHPLDSGSPRTLSVPLSWPDVAFIRRLHTLGSKKLGNNAHVIFGGTKAVGWGVGVWTFDEVLSSDPRSLVAPITPGLLDGIYCLPVQIVDDRTLEPLNEQELLSAGLVYTNLTRPYPSGGIADVSDIIALREWVLAATSFIKNQSHTVFVDSPADFHLDTLARLLSNSSMAELRQLRDQLTLIDRFLSDI
ncbi:hypothetical protein HZC07_02240 [Candidatus Micrarchaeota archaeon]|nr:hypothetical protein [Candidatus Micrarchaeota archaeon]